MSKSQSSVSHESVVDLLQRTDLAHWQQLSRRIADPVVARLVVRFLDDEPHLREQRVGVYLAASETVKRSQITYARWRRLGVVVGTLLRVSRKTVVYASGAVALMRAGATSEKLLRPASVVTQREAGEMPPMTLTLKVRPITATLSRTNTLAN